VLRDTIRAGVKFRNRGGGGGDEEAGARLEAKARETKQLRLSDMMTTRSGVE